MMKTLLAALCLFMLAPSGKPDSTLDDILARMDKAAPTFHGMTADVNMVEYQKILDSPTKDSGSVQMQRVSAKNVRAIVKFNDRWLGFMGDIVKIYYPNLKTYQEIKVGKNGDVLNQFLLLGFGASGKDLAKNYDITLLGTEKLANQDTSKLQLITKDPKVKEKLTKIWVWIPDDSANPVQQQFFEPSGNYRLVTYSNIQINPAISGTLELKLPPGAQRQG